MTPRDDNPCFTDFALQEYVQGRLDPEVRRDVEAHCGSCAECHKAVELLRAEADLLRRSFESHPGNPEAPTDADTETLARYLDGGLDADAAQALEARLATEPRLLYSLVRLRAEVSASVAEQGDGTRAPVPAAPAGEVLRMPKRVAPPAIIGSEGLKYGGGQAG